jgi:hypothetical protein
MTADHHGWTARLHGSGVGVDAGEVRVAPLEARRLVAPQGAHGVDVLVGARAALGERHADGAHFRLEVAGTDAEDQPSLRQHVEARDLLGEYERVALRQDDDAGPEAQLRGAGRDEGQVDERVEDRVAWLHGRRRHPRAGQHHVLAGPHRVVAESLRLLGERKGGIGRVNRHAVESEDAELHGG